ncbi:hypothetical protein SAMN05216474_2433 [Lishizhenia tianjinensis]|uniref:Outer membrane protein beta-barrel domain-containing protein n=2 Tax=Lishizhenia tianjinensis TaxID=477690 RepID=A0A1I7B067_9FLAO|nr:hypothetical protein SAMN05216474_2433 [Lishizhenia tianjinensis]
MWLEHCKMKKINLLLLLLCCLVGQTTIAQSTKKTRLSAWSLELGLEKSFLNRGNYYHSPSTSNHVGSVLAEEQVEFFLPLGGVASLEYTLSKKLALSFDVAYHHIPTLTDTYRYNQVFTYGSDVYERKMDEFGLYSAYVRAGLGLKLYFRKAPMGGYFKINANYYSVNSDVHRTTTASTTYEYYGYTYEPVKITSTALGVSLEWGKRKVIGDRFFADFGVRYTRPILSFSDNTYDADWNNKVFVNNEIRDYFPTSNMHYHQFKSILAEYMQFYLKFGIYKFNI